MGNKINHALSEKCESFPNSPKQQLPLAENINSLTQFTLPENWPDFWSQSCFMIALRNSEF
jgi:hypothetical protein